MERLNSGTVAIILNVMGETAEETKPNKNKKGQTDQSLIKAIYAARGNITNTAKLIGLSRCHLSTRINSSPELVKAVEEAKEIRLDIAESKLDEAVEKGEGWAICFILKCLGKKRGYIEKSEAEIANEAKLAELLADIAAAVRSTDVESSS